MFLAIGESFFDIIGLREGDVFFNDRSLGWLGGAPVTYVKKGISRVLIDLSTAAPADPVALMWQAMREERCTVGLFISMQIDMSLTRPELWQNVNPRLRVVVTGELARFILDSHWLRVKELDLPWTVTGY